MELFKLCWRLSITYLKTLMEYRVAFITNPLANFVSYLSDYVLIWVYIDKFNSIKGWTFYEMLVLFSLNLLAYGIAGYFFYVATIMLGRKIQSGDFDIVLLKPMNPLLYMVASGTNNTMWANISIALIALIIGLVNLAIEWTFLKVAFLIVAVIGGILIQISAFLIAGTFSFWTNSPTSFREVIFENARGLSQYPISIYGTVFQVLLTFIVPFAFINFYPSQYLMGKGQTLFHPILQYGTPIVGVVIALLAYQLWRIGIRHYQSTGS